MNNAGSMYGFVARLLDVLDSDRTVADEAIRWSCPVPFFGHLESARLATVGINPSNREFVDEAGKPLRGAGQRLPTLSSLNLTSWGQADHLALRAIIDACRTYFDHNPYDRWFGSLERLFERTGCSYYPPSPTACHLDIVPWATTQKWGLLTLQVRHQLVERAARVLVDLITHSSLTMLVLNGQEVVRRFQAFVDRPLRVEFAPSWDLARRSRPAVKGVAFRDVLTSIGGVALDREITVLGYNHNLQSSFGVTSAARSSIGEWIADQYTAVAA